MFQREDFPTPSQSLKMDVFLFLDSCIMQLCCWHFCPESLRLCCLLTKWLCYRSHCLPSLLEDSLCSPPRCLLNILDKEQGLIFSRSIFTNEYIGKVENNFPRTGEGLKDMQHMSLLTQDNLCFAFFLGIMYD